MAFEDDWLFDSIKKYNQLYMYDLQKTVLSADWVSTDRMVVAISDGKKHELLELALPAQIYVGEQETGLTKDRDFRVVNGGFSDSCAMGIKHLNRSKNIVVSVKGDNSVELWQLGTGDNNLIEKTAVFASQESSCHSSQLCLVQDSQLLFGSHLSGLSLVDISTQKMISHAQERKDNAKISNFIHQGTSILVLDQSKGNVYVLDPRVENLKTEIISECCNGHSDERWMLCDNGSEDNSELNVLQLSSAGKICVRDSRNLKQCVKHVNTGLKSCQDDFVLSRCPTRRNILAMTGFNGDVQLYDEETWTSGTTVTPVFTHQGHSAVQDNQSGNMYTTFHLWYPWKQQTLLSTGSDGSLHMSVPVF